MNHKTCWTNSSHGQFCISQLDLQWYFASLTLIALNGDAHTHQVPICFDTNIWTFYLEYCGQILYLYCLLLLLKSHKIKYLLEKNTECWCFTFYVNKQRQQFVLLAIAPQSSNLTELAFRKPTTPSCNHPKSSRSEIGPSPRWMLTWANHKSKNSLTRTNC